MNVADLSGLISALSPLLPEILAFIKGLHQGQQPGQPPLTDAQALLILKGLTDSTIQVDENWKASHPA